MQTASFRIHAEELRANKLTLRCHLILVHKRIHFDQGPIGGTVAGRLELLVGQGVGQGGVGHALGSK